MPFLLLVQDTYGEMNMQQSYATSEGFIDKRDV